MKNFLLLIFLVMVIVSCGYKEGVIQRADKSFLNFTGNLQEASVQIDNAEPFMLKSYVVDAEGQQRAVDNKNKLYQISPGKHNVKVYRGGQLVVNRILILDNNVIKEVQIP